MGMIRLVLAALIAMPVAASETDSERAVLEGVIERARRGELGFTPPEGWTWQYVPNYGACMTLLTTSCALVEGEAPFEESERTRPIWAATDRSAKHTVFFKGSASPRTAGAASYVKPGEDASSVTIIGPHEMTAEEMAAYVLGHEVHGHLVEDLGGSSIEEMRGNYFGFAAVRALRGS
jgi:hypothetical protein